MLLRKLFFFLMILAAFLPAPLSAQGRETLAVLDFTTEAVSETEMTAIVEYLSAELFDTDKYIVIDVSQRETILREMEFSMSGCSDDSCALEIGKMLSAELIVTGNLSKVGSRYLMSVKMLETETSRTMGTANGKYNDLDELIDGLEPIAFKLAGQEDASKISVVSDVPDAEDLPEEDLPEEDLSEEDLSATKPDNEFSTETGAERDEEFNIPVFALSVLGTIGFIESGFFSNLSLSANLSAKDAYEAYMSVGEEPGSLYSGGGDEDYQHFYDLYKRNILITYVAAGTGGALSASYPYLGEAYLSVNGKITSAAGTLALTIGNILSMTAANSAVSNIRLYNDYLSGKDPDVVSVLYNEYEEAQGRYEIQQYISYGMWGTGGLLSIASWFIPGEKTIALSGILKKIVYAAGHIALAGGNFTNQLALSSRLNAENVYDDYKSAVTSDAAASLFETYDDFYTDYKRLTYTTYGLWGGGAAAVITAILLPDSSTAAAADSGFDLELRPALTGAGISVGIKIK